VPGIQKFVVGCNWKFSVDNVFDWYHAQITHMSAQAAGMLNWSNGELDNGGARTVEGKDLGLRWRRTDMEDVVLVSEYGHASAGPTYQATVATNPFMQQAWRERPEAQALLGPVGANVNGHSNIFPTLWINSIGAQVSLRVPRSPDRTEIWWFTFTEKNAPAEIRRRWLARQSHMFGPAGILEQDDGENWAQSTMQTHGLASRQIPQLLKMQLGRGKIIKEDGLARIETTTNEHGQLWHYLAWKEWMSGCSWQELHDRTVPGEYL
jgi:hypothetical protein